MRKIIVGVATSVLLIGCSGTIEAKNKKETNVEYRGKLGGNKYNTRNYVVDKRTGCLVASVSWASYDSGMVQVLDPEGKPVGCSKAGGLTVDEYFALPQDK